MKVIRRGNRFYFRKRVPRRFLEIEHRGEIWRPLESRSERAAEREADKLWAGMLGIWEGRSFDGLSDLFRDQVEAKKLAASMGFRYLPSESVERLPLVDLMDRVERIFEKGELDARVADALLGGVNDAEPKPSILLQVYLRDHRYRFRDMSPAQAQTWRQNRVRSMNMLITTFGDHSLDRVSNDDLLELRAQLWGRVEAGFMTPSSANALMEYADQVLDHCRHRRGFKFEASFRHLRFTDRSDHRGVSFSTEWIQDKILDPPALNGLEPQARGILLGMINTGYRLSEGANLLSEDIRLEGGIPHIVIQPHNRRLKTIYSKREIPLFGVSLEAFQAFPNGFSKYHDRRSLSQKLNRYLRDHGLAETPKHTMRSFRHALSDRLVDIETEERVIRTILGHKIPGTSYGRGTTLEHKAKYLARIALHW